MTESADEQEIQKNFECDADTLFRSIGSFIFNFSRFEDVVRGRVQKYLLIGYEQYPLIMPAMDFAYLCRVCKRLVEERFEANKREQILSILSEGLRIGEDRNRVAHGSWYMNKPAGVAVHLSRNKLDMTDHFLQPGELDKITDRLILMRHRLWELTQE